MLASGSRLGPYEIVAPLGTGGMGEVYRARDPKLNRDVAVKVLPSSFAGDLDRLTRFEREARMLAALNHPHIGAIYGLEDADGVPALVLELVEGETLAARIARGPLALTESLTIACQLASAIDAAHSKGIVHRDLKPANIKITHEGVVKVLDFGLAKASIDEPAPSDLTESPTAAADWTREGVILGTTAYMSPEQARGRPVDKRADIWAFGCVLYEMLTGSGVFSGETVSDTIAAILERAPGWSALPAATPAPVHQLLQRCLEKDVQRRLGDIGDARVVLETSIGGKSRAMGLPSGRRTALWFVAASGVAVALLAWTLVQRPVTTTDSIAILPFINDSGNPDVEYLSDGLTESLINTLSQVPHLVVMSRTSVFRYKGREADVQSAGAALNVRSVVTGRVVQRGDDLSISAELVETGSNRILWGQQYTRKLTDILAVQEEISAEISDALKFKLTGEERKRLARRYTQNAEAYQLYLRGRFHWNKKTTPGFLKGIEYFEQAIEADPNYAPAYAALAALYNNLANYNFGVVRPKEAWAKAKAAAERAIEIDDNLASAHASLALVAYQWEWDWVKAESEFKRSLALDSNSTSTFEPSPSSTHHWYSHYLMTMGRVDESLSAGRRALDLEPLDLANNSHQGWHFLFTRQYDHAIESLRKTIDLDPNFIVGRWYLGLVHEQQGAFADAITQFSECVRLTGQRPSMVALLGHAYAVANRRSEARAILQQLSARSTEQYVPPYPIAVVHAGLGETDEAFAWLEKAYDERDSWLNYVALDPRLDPLRQDSRYGNLLRRLKLAR